MLLVGRGPILGNLRPLATLRLYTTTRSAKFNRQLFRFDHEKGSMALGSTAVAMDPPEVPARPIRSLLQLPLVYSRLCKAKLSSLVVCTTLSGYLIAPTDLSLLTMISSGTLWSTLIGTALCAGSANAWNQWAEIKHDSKMLRTRCRPLPTKQIGPMHAFGWATACASVGLTTLYFGAGHVACALAATTIGLYTLVYTPLKRYTVMNTWVGAVVGGIPPLIGYAGALFEGSGLSTFTALLPDAALLGLVLYCWQFPHFNALAHNLRQDYNRAGYCMAAIHRPALNRSSALLHAAALIPLTVAFTPLGTGLADYALLLDGGLLGAWMTYLAGQFYLAPGKGTARRLFLGSLLYLPLFLVFLVLHRKLRRPQETIIVQK